MQIAPGSCDLGRRDIFLSTATLTAALLFSNASFNPAAAADIKTVSMHSPEEIPFICKSTLFHAARAALPQRKSTGEAFVWISTDIAALCRCL